MYTIDMNCDLGESFGRFTIGRDEEVIPYITSANVACGYHASDPMVMGKTVQIAKKNGVHVGAHIGFPDLMGFGRRNMVISPEEAKTYTMYQMGALMGFLAAEHMTLSHVKPHGAFYNMAAKDYQMSLAICEGIKAIDSKVALMGLAGSEMIRAAKAVGIPVIQEVFADRAYEEDGTLVARSKPGAMIEDENEAIQRVIRMVKDRKVNAITGKDVDIQPDSVCVHGDGKAALLFVKKIREALEREGILIK
ncbi:MAG: LamB/YcsF family protein [Lachnospiraceae bacterium]|nr:LamB/YcsF family protein [Lachnospiraceae bacterium]